MTYDKPAEGFEVFCDESYYNLWAARKIGETSFYETKHFNRREHAILWTHDPNNDALEIAYL